MITLCTHLVTFRPITAAQFDSHIRTQLISLNVNRLMFVSDCVYLEIGTTFLILFTYVLLFRIKQFIALMFTFFILYLRATSLRMSVTESRILKTSASKIGRADAYSDRGFSWFFSLPSAKSGIVT